jgi:hypothetical protein
MKQNFNALFVVCSLNSCNIPFAPSDRFDAGHGGDKKKEKSSENVISVLAFANGR